MSELKAKKYTVLSNILFSLNTLRRESPATLARAAVGVVARIAAPFTAILLPKLVLDGLTNHVTPAEFIASVGGGTAALAALTFLRGYTDVTLNPGQEVGMVSVNVTVTASAVKRMDMDFELLSDPEVKELETKAGQTTGSNHTPANNLPAYLANLLVQLGGFALYGTVISSVHWAILPLLALSAVVVGLMLRRARKYEEEHRGELDETGMKFFYVVRALNDAELAKDLRLFSMTGWLKANGSALFKRYRDQSGRVAGLNMQAQLAGAAMVLLRDGAAYALLVYLLLKERVTLGDFTLMFAAIGAFAGWVQGIIEQAGETLRASAQLAGYREYIDVPDRMNRGAGAPMPDTGAPPEIALENVSYKYPGADGCALENISLTIRAGERLAVVGVNGAGKSTLVKLICGLYRPTAGTIKLDGTDISRFNRDEYYTLFTAVFQEINEMTTSIAGNVSQQPPANTDTGRVERCLTLSGLWDKVRSFPDGMDTQLVKTVEPTAIELSGGEKQKLALARALYKEAPVIILDEPTAALDPIAESETYMRYAELTAGKTSVYISHRLASTRFCDRIVMLDGCVIAEEGTHGELMELGGKYAEMFNVQASYYREGDASENED